MYSPEKANETEPKDKINKSYGVFKWFFKCHIKSKILRFACSVSSFEQTYFK